MDCCEKLHVGFFKAHYCKECHIYIYIDIIYKSCEDRGSRGLGFH